MAPLIELGAGFDFDLTAKENVYLNGALLGYSRKVMEGYYDDIVEFSELHDFMDVPVKNFSSGMVSRLAFAIATIGTPDILKMCIRDRVYLDMEDSSTAGVGKKMLGSIAKTFCDTISNAGYKTGIYANLDWWSRLLTDPVFNNSSCLLYTYSCTSFISGLHRKKHGLFC